jgi:hypothetical protein
VQNSLALEDFRYFARRSENHRAKSPALFRPKVSIATGRLNVVADHYHDAAPFVP